MVHTTTAVVSQLQMWWNVPFFFFGRSYSVNCTAKTPAQMSQGTQVHSPATPDEASAAEKKVQQHSCSNVGVPAAEWCKVFAVPPPPQLGHVQTSKVIQVRNQNHFSKEGSVRGKGVLASSHLPQRIRDLVVGCQSLF